eukprot:jgi/Picre1/33234/NNA_008559.t1
MERLNKKKKEEVASAKKPRERKVMKELKKSAEAPGQQTLNSFLQRTGRSSNDGDDSTIPSGTENVQRNEQQPPSVAAQAVVEEETRSRNDPDATVQDNNRKQEEEVVDLTTIPEDLHDDGIPESQDAASHAEQVKEDYGESGISLLQQLRPLHALVSQSRDERESRRPAIEGCMALVSLEQFESWCAIGRQAVPITVDDGSSHPYVVDAPRLMQGMGILEKTALAHAIYSDTTCQGTLFRKEEYPSLVSSSLGMFVCVEDVIEWMMENLDGFILEEVKEAFQQQQFGAFVRMLENQNMLHMMEDIYSGYMRPTVKIVELKVSISLFDLILHIKEPGVCRMYLLEDGHTAAPSHVPGLFYDSQDNIHLYWSQPWPLGVVDTGSKGERREPFSCSDVLVMSNGVIFSPVSGRVRMAIALIEDARAHKYDSKWAQEQARLTIHGWNYAIRQADSRERRSHLMKELMSSAEKWRQKWDSRDEDGRIRIALGSGRGDLRKAADRQSSITLVCDLTYPYVMGLNKREKMTFSEDMKARIVDNMRNYKVFAKDKQKKEKVEQKLLELMDSI